MRHFALNTKHLPRQARDKHRESSTKTTTFLAVTVFGKNDPFHFGDLGSAMLTLFRIATQEDWTDIMYFNMFGCDKWGDYGSDVSESTKDCVPEAFGATSPAFFVLCVASHHAEYSAVRC